MNHFEYKNGELFCEDVAVAAIAKEVGTPFYLYSRATLKRHFLAFDSGFADINHLTCFAVKSCSNIAILLKESGAGKRVGQVSFHLPLA